MTPIEKFKDTAEAVTCMKEWKHCLGLDDWIIRVDLVEPHSIKLADCEGECEYTGYIKTAVIRILKPEYYGNRIEKYCAERTLVHELLHCKLAMLRTEDEGFNNLLHQTQEDIARALICGKYGIDREWFDNISYE
jgi:hypothetical protein